MGNVGGIEKVLVGLILVIILTILGIAISGTTGPMEPLTNAGGPAPPAVSADPTFDARNGHDGLSADPRVKSDASNTNLGTPNVETQSPHSLDIIDRGATPIDVTPPRNLVEPPKIPTLNPHSDEPDERSGLVARPDGTTEHVVKDNDTFTSIALLYYQDARMVPEIQKMNEDLDPSRLYVGQRVRLPSYALVAELKAPESSPKANKPTPKQERSPDPAQLAKNSAKVRQYQVKKGDTLSSIAREFYNDSERWPDLVKANRLQDPNNLRVGMTLIIP